MNAAVASAPPLLNEEAPLRALARPVTPTADFFQRTNFLIPEIDSADWSLSVDGLVRTPLTLSWNEVRSMPSRTVAVTLECAGNGRGLLTPLPAGQPWGLGAVSTALFTGVPLRAVLGLAGLADGAVEVLFAGADAADIGSGRTERFERSLPLNKALHPDVLLAWEMNGQPLPPRHGYPLRLVVPGWYGVASVKWLTEIRVLDEAFEGHFQTERYIYIGDPETPDGTPVARMRVRALIGEPSEGEQLTIGMATTVRGTAWSGDAPVSRVEVSFDGGEAWHDAELGAAPSPYAALPWSIAWTPTTPGHHLLLARATDAAGNVQPLAPVWNQLGYGNNAVHRLEVEVG
jgi:DMSO/TMAO reductase YedYZ molybdopterin-dependent catalytic subunit